MNVKDNCIFCQIVAGTKPSSVVYRDERCMVFLDIRPINDGHLLVIPNMHAASLAELVPDEGAHCFRVAQKLAAALRKSGIRCEGVNLLLSDGRAAMQDVFHVHLHVIPRFLGDGFGLRFGPSFGRRPSREELDEVAGKIKGQIKI